MKLFSISPFISVLLTPVLVVAPLWAQTPARSEVPLPDAAVAQSLQLRLIARESAQAVNSRTAKGFTVEVTDAAGTAVPEAVIALRLPDSGATGTFADGTHSAVAYTDNAGRAQIANIHWAETPGLVVMRVTATKGTSHAGMLIEQTLTAAASAPALASTPNVTVVTVAPPAAPPVTQPTTPQTLLQPGTPQVTPVKPQAMPGTPQVIAKTVPPVSQDTAVAHPLVAQNTAPKPPPAVTVSTPTAGDAPPHKSHTKWIILALVAAGAGAGVAMAGKGKSSTPAAAAPSLSIASTGIIVGQPAH